MIKTILEIFNPKEELSEVPQKPEPLKVVNIYDEKGVVIKTIKGVYITHWDTNIYIIEDENNEYMMRLNISNNMMLVTHNVGDSDANGECKYFTSSIQTEVE